MKSIRPGSGLFLLTLFLSSAIWAADAIRVSHIQGLDSTPGLMSHTTIRYYIHNEVGEYNVQALGNPLELTSLNGTTWQAPPTTPLIMLGNYFDGLAIILNYGGAGTGADTIDFYGFNIFRPGFPPGFDEDVFFIETRLSDEDIGKTLCLDSVWTSVSEWLWATSGGAGFPSWDGPHCYQIVDCCVGN